MFASPLAAQVASPAAAPTQLTPIMVEGERERIEGYRANNASSPKYTAPLLDTPQSITIISEELIKDRGATSLVDVLRTVPGITLGSGEGGTPEGDRPFIRGYESSTDILIDGMRDYARGSHETFNLESVEVVKGPSSVYSGRGSTGGTINLVTKAPKLGNFAEGSIGLGTHGNTRLLADGNWSFSESAAFRLNLMKTDGNVPGRNVAEVDRLGIAPTLAFGLGTPTRVILGFTHVQVNDTPDWGIPYANASRPDRITPPDVDRKNFYGRAGVDYRKNTSNTASVRVEHDLQSGFKFRNSSRYVTTVNDYLFTRPSFDNCAATVVGRPANCFTEAPGVEFTRADRARYRTSEALVNQTDVTGEFVLGGLRHRIATGLEFSREEIFSKAVTGLPGSTRDDLYNPNPYGFAPANLVYGPKTSDGHIDTKAAYLFDTIKFTEQWEASAGVRYDNYSVTNNVISRSDNIWNYQLGLVYKPVSYGSIYVSHGTSSNPSGENLGQAGGADGAASGATIRDLDPEKNRSLELGTKWDLLNRKLSLTGALFETKKVNGRTYDTVSQDVVLDGDSRVRGLELGAAGAITSAWSVWAGYSYLDPKITKYRGGAGANTDYSGNQMKFIAKQSLSLWSTYKVLPQLTIGGGATYTGKRFVDDANTLELKGTWRFDAMARYSVNRNLSLQLNLNNLSNETLYDASHVGVFAKIAPGRSAMMTATYRYN
jgi:catecholate siderophore receptor